MHVSYRCIVGRIHGLNNMKNMMVDLISNDTSIISFHTIHRDYFMVGWFLFTSCERSLDERVSAANE